MSEKKRKMARLAEDLSSYFGRGQEHEAELFLAVYFDGKRTGKADVAHEARFGDGGKGVEDRLVANAVARKGIDGEIAHAERREVLEEVRALRGIDPIVGKTGLNDDAGGRDVRPFHGNAQPRIARSPTAGANQHAVAVFGEKGGVDALDVVGDEGIVGGRIAFGLDVDHIGDVVHDAVAEGVVAAQQHVFFANGGEVDEHVALDVDHGADLEQVEHAGAASGVDVDGKLYLDGAAHFALAQLQHLLHEHGQGEDVVFEHADETDDLPSAGIEAGADDLVGGVEGGGDELQRAVFFGFFDGEA